VNNFFYSIYKYLPKYRCRILSIIKKTNIGGTQLPDKASPLHAIMHVPLDCYLRSRSSCLRWLSWYLVLSFVRRCSTFIHEVQLWGVLATSGECLQLHSRLPWKSWRPLLERAHDRRLQFPWRPRPPANKCIGHLLLNGGTVLPQHHSNSHPPSLCKLGPPSPIEMTKSWSPCSVLLLCIQAPLNSTFKPPN
jgi:hypothetical protein